VILRDVDGDLFLLRPDQPGVFHLNAVAACLWHLIEQPTSMAMAAAALRDVFPGADPRRIKRDVKTMFAALHNGGLIRTVKEPAAEIASERPD
jgi:hypothetical protein